MAAKGQQDWCWGTGRRKSAVARVRLREGTGNVVVNGKSVEDFFSEDRDRAYVYSPLVLVEMKSRLDVFVNVKGGGFSGQAGATRQGIARALLVMFSESEEEHQEPLTAEGEEGAEPEVPVVISVVKKLRDSGYLTRDSRMKERKKYGQKGARKSFQFSKR